MTAEELRIGNFVLSDGEKVEVTGVEKDRVYWKWCLVNGFYNIDNDWIEDIHPIPLTPEILEKCGDISLVDEIIFYHDVPVKYLHQLQNLYFALTGEELKINL